MRGHCASARALSASGSCRSAKAWKLSSGPERSGEIGAQQALDLAGAGVERDVAPQLAADAGALGEAAADDDRVALDRLFVLAAD